MKIPTEEFPPGMWHATA